MLFMLQFTCMCFLRDPLLRTMVNHRETIIWDEKNGTVSPSNLYIYMQIQV